MNDRYGLTASWLHWISAILVVAMIPIGKYMSDLDVSADKAFFYRAHAAAGILVLLLTLWRVFLALRGSRPAAGPRWPAWMSPASRAVHIALYALLLVLATSGIATMAFSGLGDVLISGDLARWPDLDEVTPAGVHGLLGNILIALFVVHVAAALYHHFVLRDGILERIALKRS